MTFTKNDEAVSPVIGVILMVAITVILAAVIAAFVFGMAGNVSKAKTVAITGQRTTSNSVVVTNMGGPDVGSLSSVTCTPSCSGVTATVGSTGTAAVTSGGRLIVTGTFNDGQTVVLLDSKY